jgi:hypothetical protein
MIILYPVKQRLLKIPAACKFNESASRCMHNINIQSLFFTQPAMGRLYRRTTRATAMLLLLLLFLAATTLTSNHAVSAQQEPFFTTKKFDKSASHRTDFCERHQQILSGDIKLEDALRGLNVSVVMTNFKDAIEKRFFGLNEKGAIDPTDVPLHAKILDELGRRAGFSWRNSFGVVKPLNTSVDKDENGKNRTYSDL